MALINCPECGKEISDKSEQCIHCGYPLKPKMMCSINGQPIDLSYILDPSISEISKVNQLRKLTNCGLKDAYDVIDNILATGKCPKTLLLEIIDEKDVNQIKCPTCSSTNVKRISETAKIAGALTFGIFSTTAKSQFKCENCGYKW